jgi:hypothetical protein
MIINDKKYKNMENTITIEGINSIINSESYFDTGKTTVCILILQNGFEVVGTSAPVDKKNFNKELGEKYAKEVAIKKVWELEGYRLQCELSK